MGDRPDWRFYAGAWQLVAQVEVVGSRIPFSQLLEIPGRIEPVS